MLLLLTPIPEWWPLLGAIPIALGLLVAMQKAWSSLLAYTIRQNKLLKADNARLVREGEIRLDDLKDCWAQIDELQKQVTTQRQMAKDLIESGDQHGK